MQTVKTARAYARWWEVDTIRGVAVILMIIYHLAFDLAFFGASQISIYSTPWQLFGRSIGATFILVMGISLTLRYQRLTAELDRQDLFRQYLQRGAKLVGLGMVITVVTYFFVGSRFVVFGILHLLGLSVILAFPFVRSRWASLAGAVVVLVLGAYVSSMAVTHPWLLWLGVPQVRRAMVDYYPLLPWFAFALLGIFLGLTLYPQGTRRVRLPDLSRSVPIRGLAYLGQHSLIIYLVHQPVLLGLLILLGIISI
jgi:uncharacterized membrane protein